jgi:hypothetical protein
MGRYTGQVGARQRDRAPLLRMQAHDAPQQRGLAGAVAAAQRDDLARADPQAHLVQDRGLAVAG